MIFEAAHIMQHFQRLMKQTGGCRRSPGAVDPLKGERKSEPDDVEEYQNGPPPAIGMADDRLGQQRAQIKGMKV
jgi:hypothetical protein